jgi:hypothetical protein
VGAGALQHFTRVKRLVWRFFAVTSEEAQQICLREICVYQQLTALGVMIDGGHFRYFEVRPANPCGN